VIIIVEADEYNKIFSYLNDETYIKDKKKYTSQRWNKCHTGGINIP
jgi:hypothetical protein